MLVILVTAALAIPLAVVIILAVGRLLGAMQDSAGAAVLDRLALALGILWALDLACLLIALAINALGPPPQSPGDAP